MKKFNYAIIDRVLSKWVKDYNTFNSVPTGVTNQFKTKK